MSKESKRVGRRSVIKGLSGLGMGMLLSACSGGGSDDLVSGAPAAPGAGGGGGGGGGGGITGPVTGRVDTTQIGGQNLSVLSAFQLDGLVDPTGAFQTTVATGNAQIVFVRDGGGVVRGMAVSLPGSPLTFDAASTATALVFMSPGIGTTDAALAAQQVQNIQNAPSFNALVAELAGRLPNADVPTAVADPAVQVLLQLVAQEVFAAAVPRTVSARTTPFTEKEQFLDKPGRLRLLRNPDIFPDAQFEVENGGFRYVSVVRQSYNLAGELVQTVQPMLQGSPFSGTPSVVGGVNALSVGNLVFGQVDAPGTAIDLYSLPTSNYPVDRSVYYLRGLGFSGHEDSYPEDAIPAEVKQAFDTNLSGGITVPGLANGFTFVYYLLFPFLEPILGVVGLATKTFDEVINLFGQASLGATGLGLQTSANQGGQDAASVTALGGAMVDAIVSIVSLATTVLAETLAAEAALAGAAATATVFSTVIAAALAAMSVVNFINAADYFLNDAPATVVVEVRHPTQGFLEFLGDDRFEPLAVSAKGTVLYNFLEGGNNKNMYFRPLGKTASFMAVGENFATINDTDLLLHQVTSFDDPPFLRRGNGPSGPLLTPSGAARPNAEDNLSVSPDSKYASAAYVRDLPNNDDFRDLFTYELATQATRSTDLAGALTVTNNTDLFTVGGLSNTKLYATARTFALGPPPKRSGVLGRTDIHTWHLCTYDLATRSWSVQDEQNPVNPDFPSVDFEYRYVDVNSKDDALVTQYYGGGDADTVTLIRRSFVVMADGSSRAVMETEQNPEITTGNAINRHDAVAIDDFGQVLGRIGRTNDTTNEPAVIWDENGVMRTVASLLPTGSPAGNWELPSIFGRDILRNLMGGAFVLLERRVNDTKSYYLWYRGVTKDQITVS